MNPGRLKRQRDEERRQWLRAVEERAAEIDPGTRGNLDWDTAYYLHSQGKTVEEAAARLSELRKGV